MSTFTARSPRVEAQFPIDFLYESQTVGGNCLNISESGLLAVFAWPLELWTVGELALHFGEGCLGIKARVVRSVERETGLAFQLSREDDRVTIQNLLRAIRQAGEKGPSRAGSFIA